MKLFHGSNMAIDSIDLSRSHRGKDFGCGFYLSDNYEQAFRMACLTVERTESGTPIVTSFEISDDALNDKDINIKRFDTYTVEWAEFVLANRNNKSHDNVHPFDIVIGPIANDKVGVQIRRYLLGDITVEQLVAELQFRQGITFQYFFANEKAINLLERL